MKKYVLITSTITIEVTRDLGSVNLTNPTAPMADKLNVKPRWVPFRYLIKAGTYYYPAQIKNWKTVKSLEKDRLLTIGAETDDCGNTPKEEVEQIDEAINRMKNADARNKKLEQQVNPMFKQETKSEEKVED